MSTPTERTEHTWIIEVIDGGPAGDDDFWKCSVCGASGGPVGHDFRHLPILAGPALPLSLDCREAAAQFRIYNEHQRRIHTVTRTGIYVRAQRNKKWESVDIAELDAPSLLAWLRSRGGHNPLAEDVVGILFGHGHLTPKDEDPT